MIHNASIEKYRKPIGAVEKGEKVTLRLFDVPEYKDKIEVVVDGEGIHEDCIMTIENGCATAVITVPDKCVVLWYYFRIWGNNHVSYYGARPGKTQGEGMEREDFPVSFQLTVFEKGFDTPRWMSKGIMYQIFPDRFAQGNPKNLERGAQYHRNMGRDIFIHDSWEERPLFAALPGKEFYDPCDFFGGDLEGIIGKLDELKRLGVSCLYLNPVAESSSNHRYNTSDYKRVDPILGTESDFRRLCRLAESKGMHVVLDGVYSHTGDDSVYFNKKGNYPGVGAYQGPDSPYYDWYSFDENGNYKSWWGFNTLPEVNEMNEKFLDYVITGDDSVIKTWLERGTGGFRLDVADELPDEFISILRKTLKEEDPDAALIGEVWEDATTKESYGVKRQYALGNGLDSTMNYPLKVHIVSYLLHYENAYAMQEFLLGQQCNYPKPLFYALMNLLSSHDIPRIRTTLATGMNETFPSRENQIDYTITSAMDKKGATLARLAMAIQFAVPGMPSIYYGDEYGMSGLMDPFNRGTFYKNDESVYQYLLEFTAYRSRDITIQTGHALYFAANDDVLGIVRFCVDGKDAFGEKAPNGVKILLVNPSDEQQEIAVDLTTKKEGVEEAIHQELMKILPSTTIQNTIPAMDYVMLDLL